MAYAKYFLSETKPKLNPGELKSIIKRALTEDIGRGDITTQLNIPKDICIRAEIIAQEDFLLCGIDLAGDVFKTVDPGLKFAPKIKEGRRARNKDTLAIISGKAGSILTAERVALNLLSLLSGIATKTFKFVKRIEPFKSKITDTRKTFPGLRALEKYAVRIGSGYNHRMRLDEMVLIKDNHLKIMGGYSQLLKVPKGCKIEIETQNLKEFLRALSFRPDIIMLDNMKIRDIQKAVNIRNNLKFNGRRCPTLLEASGGIHLGNVRKYAATGVEIISIGELTDSIESVDISLAVV
ncbi:MAG: carboxylating nicotinate-nucleotide diphosphorylase [Candidatus Omnitrophica bacterium]|nr:carboxylating nicotinate-nucleotide diphosphorylase [Candidatus Omnitrophota bacterium]MBU4303520.1 carboxylating nicotinate-nucleotide diphosphorylase [Candidatus Omnitrophota bacterium]MBU4418864.1 carboxylating nicotinate-nucleotide diphosphorylase [Candidatus Omnitrophota bacterium]MBU4467790.1 carboxylating nicotinate-nucleotide diphosphorylase [Candidatus Omnitrophota bacterium]MCG2707176.1 carboxylating nicotinate-nucleotide diphosphorylase [Candidatus Omnitrophota bacterium]